MALLPFISHKERETLKTLVSRVVLLPFEQGSTGHVQAEAFTSEGGSSNPLQPAGDKCMATGDRGGTQLGDPQAATVLSSHVVPSLSFFPLHRKPPCSKQGAANSNTGSSQDNYSSLRGSALPAESHTLCVQ